MTDSILSSFPKRTQNLKKLAFCRELNKGILV